MHRPGSGRRSWTFYALAAFFALYVLFLYGPMSAIFILSFQGPTGGLTFPMNGVSLHWFGALFGQQRTGEFAGPVTQTTLLNSIHPAITPSRMDWKKKPEKSPVRSCPNSASNPL